MNTNCIRVKTHKKGEDIAGEKTNGWWEFFIQNIQENTEN